MAPNRLGVLGEDELTGHGASYFTDHHGPTVHDQNVLVAGGGNSGLQAAQEMAPVVGRVHVLTRGGWTGDCTSGTGKEIVIATGDGARSALSAKRFVRSQPWMT
ncbi:MAG TPA: hypothetical protein QGG37_07755 [Chloroflexota bacterium]|nr:hypothetical protein [Chloroflexota bacterium]